MGAADAVVGIGGEVLPHLLDPAQGLLHLRVALAELVHELDERVEGAEAEIERYVELEHLFPMFVLTQSILLSNYLVANFRILFAAVLKQASKRLRSVLFRF